jgi:Ala-tRNA(Pro) deacylase
MADLTSFLDNAGVDFDVLEHAHTERAEDEAAELGVAPEEVAKTLVLATPSGNVRAVLPASERLDLHKVSDLLEAPHKQVHLASEEDLAREYADFELGAVPPFGGKKDPVILDSRLAEHDSVVLEAGTHEQSVRLKTADLLRLSKARVADISKEEPTAG